MSVSPAKSRLQVAIAQAQATGWYSCNKGALAAAKKTVQRSVHYDLYALDMVTPHGFCPCINKSEKKFAMDNFERIEKSRFRENHKDLLRNIDADFDLEQEMNM